MPRLLLLTVGELADDPRAARAARTGVANLLTVNAACISGGSGITTSPAVPVVRVGTGRTTLRLRALGLGGSRQRGPLWREVRGTYRLGRQILETVRLVRAVRSLDSPDIVHANDFDTLPAGLLIARQTGARVVYDAHEIYTSQEPDPPRLYTAIVGQVERRLARRADAVVTVSETIARELKARFGLGTQPYVVLNCPPTVDGIQVQPGDGRLRAVYQGALGPGRYFADILDTATLVSDDVHVSIRIPHIDLEVLNTEIVERSVESTIAVLEPVVPEKLISALGGFEVGLIINRPVTRNDELVFPNKLFEYMMAGLAVVAPRLPDLARLIEGEQIGLTFEPGDLRDLARALDELAADRPRLDAMRLRARELALSRYNADAQEPVLLEAWGL